MFAVRPSTCIGDGRDMDSTPPAVPSRLASWIGMDLSNIRSCSNSSGSAVIDSDFALAIASLNLSFGTSPHTISLPANLADDFPHGLLI